ncbi:hypothetical protein CNR22_14775 [Sphingobacteriaceae bacterium]|nr:hypothetical protein CNR22_14775 [Sphingobacteriaceae bacterium]
MTNKTAFDHGPLTYKYAKTLNGRGRYGAVTIQIVQTNTESTVTDACEWATFKEAYPNFVEFDILKLWKQSAINAATHIINSYSLPNNIEVILRDVIGLYIDTCPSHIGAAMTIGIFDYCNKPLNKQDLESLDDFIESYRDPEIIPDYKQLQLTSSKIK